MTFTILTGPQFINLATGVVLSLLTGIYEQTYTTH